jgi:hypothetical protein
MKYLRAKDTISGAMGTCFAMIDGSRYELMYVKNIEAHVEKKKTEIPILGLTSKQHKAGGWKGTGSMTVYYVSSLFREIMLKYMKTGEDTYFEIMITNEDPTSNSGRQTMLLKGVNIDNMVIGKLNVEEEALDEEMKFTFTDAEMLDQFEEIR